MTLDSDSNEASLSSRGSWISKAKAAAIAEGLLNLTQATLIFYVFYILP